MVRPDKMYRVKNLDDFEKLNYDDLEIYIEKPLLYDGSEFLVLYVGKYVMKLDGDEAKIEMIEKKK